MKVIIFKLVKLIVLLSVLASCSPDYENKSIAELKQTYPGLYLEYEIATHLYIKRISRSIARQITVRLKKNKISFSSVEVIGDVVKVSFNNDEWYNKAKILFASPQVFYNRSVTAGIKSTNLEVIVNDAQGKPPRVLVFSIAAKSRAKLLSALERQIIDTIQRRIRKNLPKRAKIQGLPDYKFEVFIPKGKQQDGIVELLSNNNYYYFIALDSLQNADRPAMALKLGSVSFLPIVDSNNIEFASAGDRRGYNSGIVINILLTEFAGRLLSDAFRRLGRGRLALVQQKFKLNKKSADSWTIKKNIVSKVILQAGDRRRFNLAGIANIPLAKELVSHLNAGSYLAPIHLKQSRYSQPKK